MPALELPILQWIVLGMILFLNLILGAVLIRQGSRLRRIESSLRPRTAAEPVSDTLQEQKEANREQKKLFQSFLEEDPQRRELPKKEQFTAFRKWRDEQGLNWKNPETSA